jgi:hypothetical protein
VSECCWGRHRSSSSPCTINFQLRQLSHAVSDRRCSNATPTRRAPSSPHAKLTPANHTRLSQARCACKADNVRAGQTLCQDEARAGQCMQHAGSSSTLTKTIRDLTSLFTSVRVRVCEWRGRSRGGHRWCEQLGSCASRPLKLNTGWGFDNDDHNTTFSSSVCG